MKNINLDDWNHYEKNELLSDKNFVDFLHDNNIYNKFINNINNDIITKNYKKHYWYNINTFCDDIILSSGSKNRYIMNSFNWEKSQEGFIFWSNINYKWVEYLNKLNESINLDDWDHEEYNTKLTDNKFYNFLKKHNIYDKFINNINNNTLNKAFKGRYWNNVNNFCKEVSRYRSSEYVYYSFDWDKSPERYNFWENINKEWKKYLKTNESINLDDWDYYENELLSDKDFVDFLKRNNVYDEFINNLNDNNINHGYKNSYWYNINTFCDDISRVYGRDSYISHSFDWEKSKHFGKWSNIDLKWREILKYGYFFS